ncbi:hypothetical protein LTR65_010562 [Meristemomyces frigidus]
MQESDYAEITIRHELAQRDEAEQRDEAWSDLDLEDMSWTRHAIPVYLLSQVLREAKCSMDVPKSVSPPELSLLHCEETDFAMRALDYWADRHGQVLRISPAKLLRHLTEYMTCALDQTATTGQPFAPTPSGWDGFFGTLLKRAINFLVHRGCNDSSGEHEGLHFHEDMYFYNCLEVGARSTVAAGTSHELAAKTSKARAEEGGVEDMENVAANGGDDDEAGFEWEDSDRCSARARDNDLRSNSGEVEMED